MLLGSPDTHRGTKGGEAATPTDEAGASSPMPGADADAMEADHAGVSAPTSKAPGAAVAVPENASRVQSTPSANPAPPKPDKPVAMAGAGVGPAAPKEKRGGPPPEGEAKVPLTRAERRAIQEAQRAAKAAGLPVQKGAPVQNSGAGSAPSLKMAAGAPVEPRKDASKEGDMVPDEPSVGRNVSERVCGLRAGKL